MSPSDLFTDLPL